MLAYEMLGLKTWRVSSVGINLAYHKAAATSHPDKAAPQEKEYATIDMQQINAIKETLLDTETRTKYHRDGVIPWVI
jgi:DnaJ-class molecular chaperone